MNGELMQYTGLKDKNGTEIYEGDIIKLELKPPYSKHDNFIKVIGYMDGGFRTLNCGDEVTGGIIADWHDSTTVDKYYVRKHNVVVIGNFYEDKELLK